MAAGRVDEAIARLAELVEHPQFDLFADTEEGRAAVFRLGDALATAGAVRAGARVPAPRASRRRARGTADGTWARRAVRRLVDVALESEEFAAVAGDLQSVPPSAPEEVRGEIAYMNGRAQEAAGNPDAALAAYATVTAAVPLLGAGDVPVGRSSTSRRATRRTARTCSARWPTPSAARRPRPSSPTRSSSPCATSPAWASVASRTSRAATTTRATTTTSSRATPTASPRRSTRPPRRATRRRTTRARASSSTSSRRWASTTATRTRRGSSSAWIDLARCKFADADRQLVEFLKRYEPVRDAARRIGESDAATQRLLAAVHSGTDAGGAEIGGTSPEVVRAIAALVRVDPAVRPRAAPARGARARGVGPRRAPSGALGDMQRTLATNGGVRPAAELADDATAKAQRAREAVDGVEHEIADLEARAGRRGQDRAAAPAAREPPGRAQERRRAPEARAAPTGPVAGRRPARTSCASDVAEQAELQARIAEARKDLGDSESALAKDALHRLDLRLSRLLRRARLGRIESVLGRKRALEVEVEAIRLGYLPQDAVDSLEAARYLEDNEEYWPFEGDDWPDEYVGGETK